MLYCKTYVYPTENNKTPSDSANIRILGAILDTYPIENDLGLTYSINTYSLENDLEFTKYDRTLLLSIRIDRGYTFGCSGRRHLFYIRNLVFFFSMFYTCEFTLIEETITMSKINSLFCSIYFDSFFIVLFFLDFTIVNSHWFIEG